MPIGAIVKQVASNSVKTGAASSRLKLRKAALTLVSYSIEFLAAAKANC